MADPLNFAPVTIVTEEQIRAVCAANPLPAAKERSFRYSILSVYRRLFILVVATNLVSMGIMIGDSVQHPGSFTYVEATTAVAVNLFATVVVRHEHAINLFFRLATMLPQQTPLCIRRHAAKVYTYGGVHSGCAVSAVLWYVFFAILVIRQFRIITGVAVFYTTLGITVLILLLFVVQIVSSMFAMIRRRWHDQWEYIHRFFGWTAVILIWIQTTIIIIVNANNQHQNAGIVLIETPSFWFLTGITFLIAYPWLRLRRREVEAERLSDHAIRLWFKHRPVTTCVGIRLSRNPLLDNHGFATIPNEDGQRGFSVLVSDAGDFTKGLINRPPSHIWSRGAYTIGVARVGFLFRPLVLVATGSGIGPCLSLLQAHPDWPVHVIWSTRDPLANYGPKVVASVLRADKAAFVINTTLTRRPPLLELVYARVKETGAEAAVIISNPSTTKQIVYGLEIRQVPAFGAIFDS